MPMGSAWKLIGTLAPPIESAMLGTDDQKETHHQGLWYFLQPRVANSSAGNVTVLLYAPYARKWAGIDVLHASVFRCYQDLLFEEGVFYW